MLNSLQIDEVAWSDSEGAELRARQRAEIGLIYGTSVDPGVVPSADDIAVFLVARNDEGVAVGCGGLRYLGGGVGEVKRMYVTPLARRAGVGVVILGALESWARRQGWTTLRLETGDRLPAAQRLYERCGYRRIPNFGAYIGLETSICFERAL